VKRTGWVAIAAALCVSAQPSRDSYRAAYRAWREADPSLERDAARGGAALAARAGRAAALAAKYGAERTAFSRRLAGDDGASPVLEKAAPPQFPPASLNPEQYVAGETASVNRNIGNFTRDPDKGIQQLRRALEYERATLAALSVAITQRQQAEDAARDEAAAVEQARVKALKEDRDLRAGLKQTAEEVDRETEAWALYYRNLMDGVQIAASLPPPVAPAPQPAPPVQQSAPPVPQPAPPVAQPTPPAPQPAQPAGPPENSQDGGSDDLHPLLPSITPVPLIRYVDSWIFSAVSGVYRGPQPATIDLEVSEENGHAKGTFAGHFKLPPGSTDDPELRFEFSGEFKNTLNQIFDLKTAEGAKGTIELIPGPAFNLLEVDIKTDPRPGKIHEANMLLVKK
jgi:hypothetical protein